MSTYPKNALEKKLEAGKFSYSDFLSEFGLEDRPIPPDSEDYIAARKIASREIMKSINKALDISDLIVDRILIEKYIFLDTPERDPFSREVHSLLNKFVTEWISKETSYWMEGKSSIVKEFLLSFLSHFFRQIQEIFQVNNPDLFIIFDYREIIEFYVNWAAQQPGQKMIELLISHWLYLQRKSFIHSGENIEIMLNHIKTKERNKTILKFGELVFLSTEILALNNGLESLNFETKLTILKRNQS